MQKLPLDHWIRKRFLLSWVVYTDEPEPVPIGAEAVQQPPSSEYQWAVELPDKRSFDNYVAHLHSAGMMYKPHIARKQTWWANLIEPKPDDSLTVTWFLRLGHLVLLICLCIFAPVQSTWRLLVHVLFKF